MLGQRGSPSPTPKLLLQATVHLHSAILAPGNTNLHSDAQTNTANETFYLQVVNETSKYNVAILRGWEENDMTVECWLDCILKDMDILIFMNKHRWDG